MSKAMIQYNKAKQYPVRPALNQMLVGVNVFEPPYLASHTNVIAMAQTLGIQVIRAGITWSNMQTTVGGAISWTEYDSIYAKCVAAGITLILAIETTPAKYNTQPHGYFTSASPPTTDPSIYAVPLVTDPTYFPLWVADQAAWAGQIAARYPLALLECWNEAYTAGSGYYLENNSSANKPTISGYATLYNAMQTSVHAANPGSTLAIAGVTAISTWFGTNGTYGLEVIRQLIQTYSVNPDAISIHPYTGSASDPNPRLDHYGPNNTAGFANSFDDVRRVQQLLVRIGKGSIPLWVSEWGNWSAAAVGGEAVKADYLTYTLNRLDKVCGYGAVGPNGAPVTIATFYPMIDQSSGATDTGLVGPAGNGPYTIHASGTAFQTWMASRAPVTQVLKRLILSGDTAVNTGASTAAYTVIAIDQFGTRMTVTPTFASSATGVASINPATGVALGVSAGTANITASVGSVTSNAIALGVTSVASFDTVSYNPTTGAGIFGSSGAAPQVFDVANQWANDAAFRANISSGVSTFSGSGAGTGGGSSLYNDGVYADLYTWQNVVQYLGQPTYKNRIVGQTTVGASAPKAILRVRQALLGSCTSGWLAIRRRYPAGWTSTGDATPGSLGDQFNQGTGPFAGSGGQSPGNKSGPFAGPGGGRAGLLNTGTAWLEENVSGGLGGLTESGTGASITSEWTDDAWYLYVVHLEELTGVNGHEYFGVTCWELKHGAGASSFTRLGYRRLQDVGVGLAQLWTNLSMSGENYNMARTTDLSIFEWGWSMWNDASNSDPLGIVAYEAGLTPDAATISNVVSQTSSTATFTVGVSRYSHTVIPVVDGVEITAQSFTLPAEIADADPAENSGYLTDPCPVTRTVTGLATGAHTISFNVYNANGTAHVNTGNKSVTI